jgi:hypothetical protein
MGPSMKTRLRVLALSVATWQPLAAACHSDPVSPPPPSDNLTGAWVGTFEPADVECFAHNPARATFEQIGSSVNATLDTDQHFCGFHGVHFEGTLHGADLAGVLTGDRFRSSPATGSVADDVLEIDLTNAGPVGKMVLRRGR